jgi:hypothetical protein
VAGNPFGELGYKDVVFVDDPTSAAVDEPFPPGVDVAYLAVGELEETRGVPDVGGPVSVRKGTFGRFGVTVATFGEPVPGLVSAVDVVEAVVGVVEGVLVAGAA